MIYGTPDVNPKTRSWRQLRMWRSRRKTPASAWLISECHRGSVDTATEANLRENPRCHAFIPRERSQGIPVPNRNVGSKLSRYEHPRMLVLHVFETDASPLSTKPEHQMDEHFR